MVKSRYTILIEAGISGYDLCRAIATTSHRLLKETRGSAEEDLPASFDWFHSPQGSSFWSEWDQAISCNRPGPRTIGAVLHDAGVPLGELLRTAAEVPNHFLDERAEDYSAGRALGYAFMWDQAPQGDTYWTEWYLYLTGHNTEYPQPDSPKEEGYLEEEEEEEDKPEPRVRLTFTIPESVPISHILDALGHLQADDLEITGKGDT